MMAEQSGNITSRFARFVIRAPLVLARHIWVWPLLSALALGGVGLWVRNRLENGTRVELASRLQVLLNADIAALRLWFSEQESDVRSFAADVRIREAILELAKLPSSNSNASPAALLSAAPAETLLTVLEPLLESQHYLDYLVVGANGQILASPRSSLVGLSVPADYELFVQQALAGNLTMSHPLALQTAPGLRAEGPTLFVAGPVASPEGKIVAVLALRMKPEAEFSQIFSVARMGRTGESYAFDRTGLMLSESRFEPELKELGLIPNSTNATAILNLRLVDPGHELHVRFPQWPDQASSAFTPQPNFVPEMPRWSEPSDSGRKGSSADKREAVVLTRMAAAAVRGRDGVDVEGYRNYRGTKVVGAWAWLPEYGMGIATEVAADEAFATLHMLRQAFLALFSLLVLSGAAIFAFTLVVERLQTSLQKSALTARRLGQYVLVQEIGRGANGMIYRARHTLLRRPVAVKLLDPEMADAGNAARFEHEVQMTSQLTHPNTVAIYDYGRTPEGLFYYAMEYLSGIDLDRLVRKFGPQSEGRVIHILRQVCGSLAEAHRIGLIHRDIKPANIILTTRGGVCDTVKVLDFGLVTAIHRGTREPTGGKAVVGTPHFMPPEAIEKPQSVDSRGDIYSLGAVGYWLLTGKTLFDAENINDLLALQVKQPLQPPSVRLGLTLSADLEGLIVQCLSKLPEQRPATAEVLEEALTRCASAGNWPRSEAEKWWRTYGVGIELAPLAVMTEKTLIIAPRG